MGKYLDLRKIVNAINPATVRACLDDDGDGDADSLVVAAIINRVEGQVDSFIAGVVDITRLNNSDRLLEAASLEYAIAYVIERHPEFTKGWGKKTYDTRLAAADAMMLRIQSAVQRLPDQANSNKPKNVGGAILSYSGRMISDDPDGTTNNGMF